MQEMAAFSVRRAVAGSTLEKLYLSRNDDMVWSTLFDAVQCSFWV